MATDTPHLPNAYRIAADAMIVDDPSQPRKVVLITRKNPPHQGKFALPGGFLEPDETVEQCCIREAKEETSLDVAITRIVGVYSDPHRDPRGRTVTITYLCSPVGGMVRGDDDASSAAWFDVASLASLDFAFDHRQMLSDAGLIT
ncbi:MAG: NUDIX hydrolase [Candidatus Lokiarchaeota archaeon]|nr:NUDIX hydrolase [Candidatus Lokiarchaeota archaeon]